MKLNRMQVGAVVLLMAAGMAGASTITANMTVDDGFQVYISTDDTQLGTLLGSGSDWSVANQFTAELTPGVKNYIHIEGADLWGCIAAFLGDFTISDSAFKFTNGTQSLLTNGTDWNISNTGFGQDYYKPDEIGTNGVDPWGTVEGISPDATWIWSNHGMDVANWDNVDWSDPNAMADPVVRYFSAEITPVEAPEPATLALLGLGGLMLIRRGRIA